MARQMKDSGIEWIGEIPENWETIRFKYLHNGMNTGEAIDKENWTADDNDQVFYTAGLVPIHTNYSAFPDWKLTTADDLLLARNGTPYVYYPQVDACYTDHIIRAMMKRLGNKRFIQYCVQQSIASVVVETVSIPTWSASLWNEQVITWPSEDEQHRIAAFLDHKCAEIDAVIERTKATIEEYKKLKQAVITEAVTKGVRGTRPMKDSGIEWIGEIPEEWDMVKITRILDYDVPYPIGDGDHGLISPDDYRDDGIPYLRVQNLGWGTPLSFDGLVYISAETNERVKNSTLRPNDVLFAKTGATIGKTGIIPESMPMANTTSHVGKITVAPQYSAMWVFYVLSSHVGYRQFWQIAQQKTTRPELAIAEIKSIRLPMPSDRAEQDEIVEYLEVRCAELEKMICGKEALLTELETYKKSLIYEYVTGKKEVTA